MHFIRRQIGGVVDNEHVHYPLDVEYLLFPRLFAMMVSQASPVG
jgi:hypothetical protein